MLGRDVQALMGAGVAVFVFLIAAHALPLAWAGVAGLLTAFSPHLIALDDYSLSESLFTFATLLGALLLTMAWRRDSRVLMLLSWLPRYSIPARPFSYILAAAAPCWATDWAERRWSWGQDWAGAEGGQAT